MSPKIEPLLLTVEQASQVLQISERTIFSLMDHLQLPSVTIGKARRVRFADVRNIAEQGASLPTVEERNMARVLRSQSRAENPEQEQS